MGPVDTWCVLPDSIVCRLGGLSFYFLSVWLQTEGLTAVQRVGEFFAAGGSSCKVVCEKGERCSGTAPVNWHYHVNRLPVVPASSC